MSDTICEQDTGTGWFVSRPALTVTLIGAVLATMLTLSIGLAVTTIDLTVPHVVLLFTAWFLGGLLFATALTRSNPFTRVEA